MARIMCSQPPGPSTCHLSSYLRNDCPSLFRASPNLRLPSSRLNGHRCSNRVIGIKAIVYSQAKTKTKTKTPISAPAPESLSKEPHKYFDQVIITVRSGDGGHGALLKIPPSPKTNDVKSPDKKSPDKRKGKRKMTFKRDSDGSVILPMGGNGGDVIIYADENLDTLLEFHEKNRYHAKRGGNVSSMGVLSRRTENGLAAPTLRIAVPVGTVVKRKRGKLLADLANPGDEILVARGGQGGISLLDTPEHQKKTAMTLTSHVLQDDSDKVLSLGQPGQEVSLELILRVVADVGLVGLPNAGKSTLLSSITLAKPEIADYPFTTLMPNLGRLDGDPSLGPQMFSSEATLADLPGLIEGAHLGKGLGRNFLRHLRRTNVLVHVVDAAAADPVKDYRTVKEELRMYNPEYLERPYIVVLNKIDLPEAKDRLPFLTKEIMEIGEHHKVDGEEEGGSNGSNNQLASTANRHENAFPSELSEENKRDKTIEEYARPMAVVGVSVLKGIQVNEMLKEIRLALKKSREMHAQQPREQLFGQQPN